jgi:hypothetical protein
MIKLDVVGIYYRGIEVFLADSRRAIRIADPDGFLSSWRPLKEGEDFESAIYTMPVGSLSI